MKLTLAALILATLTASQTQAFTLDFDWSDLKPCTTGKPNTVSNPRFVVKDVPDGTTFIWFKLVDRDVPGFNHGGGVVAYGGQATIEPGAFRYKSPCPPNGSHTYEWTATAQSKKNGGVLARTSKSRPYP